MKELETIIQEFIGNYGWMFITGLLLLMFRNAIENAFYGLLFIIGNNYNVDDIVYINNEKCRIIRQGIFNTIFYSLDDNKKFRVSNNRLRTIIIKKELPKE